MEREVQQLVEMGATVAQARAALKQHKDVMEAAEHIFDGSFDHVVDDDGDVEMTPSERLAPKPRMITPAEDNDDDEAEEDDGGDEDGDDDEYIDYDDYDFEDNPTTSNNAAVDPYAGIFFSKDRREEVIEVEEEPEFVTIPGIKEKVPLLTQGQWMKGCPEGGEQSFLFGLYQQLSEGECPCPHGCGATIQRKKSDFYALFPTFAEYIKHLESIAPRTCARCSRTFCFACGESSNPTSLKRLLGSLEVDCTLFHCSNLQGAVLGVGLAMLEKSFLDDTQDPSASKVNDRSSRKRRKVDAPAPPPAMLPDMHNDDDDDDDVYYPIVIQGKKAKLGTGYAGDAREDMSGHLEAMNAQKAKDQKLSTLLSDIRTFLPSVNRESNIHFDSDFLPHPATLAHLRRRFNFVSSQLLRNDSLTDMSDRSILYFELFLWLETISRHEALASMMAMPIMVVTSVKTVAAKKSSPKGTPRIRERTIIYEGSAGPRELLEAIVIQAQAALKGLEGMKAAEPETQEMSEEQKRMTADEKGKGKDDGAVVSEENKKLLDFCLRIVNTAKAIDRSLVETKGKAFVERLHAGLPKIPATSSLQTDVAPIDAGETEESAMEAYVKWANRVRFEYCDLTVPTPENAPENEQDQTPSYKFYFNNEARMLANSDIPKRSLAIAKELAVLTTNLPVAWNSSVFLRVDETRVDIIKALITGPEGTPYYNGCFLFDVFLGPNYNQSPPSVKYMTTNGGKYRFNPNLYADGKVCLSLLGTWSGPGWIAGKSTLLQVLISIQSMILCEEPYLNEPGWANSGGTPKSLAYSANIRRMVVKTAARPSASIRPYHGTDLLIQMLGNLKAPPEPWADVIRTHFRLKARSVMAQLDKWLADDDGNATVGDGAYTQKAVASGSSNGFAEDVAELKSLLKKLQAGEDLS
ncbi:ubiquitin conjugating enzyme family protein [Dichomitus squalens]|uniref:Ubiquitin conjugating enzyme family protein n=2 Tax=Dichomitus squalens TaxID=114155 RepID=A0A4Q9Q8J9_9APHY|nr:ubiquitin conjugating enzyme family protein [Dichomitus squalens LYAD-421 SS1]EJF62236.1 ubiquitin conjugating enzyme family protein [Dichomitus squalens LYAD-421 SS1]TBU43305.1 ubiquitin conjugating enzyme family protein [Dichomitus squalens]TBU63341.1 ubiquitin conjugating enzyme family protein [Dichomitus squalens]